MQRRWSIYLAAVLGVVLTGNTQLVAADAATTPSLVLGRWKGTWAEQDQRAIQPRRGEIFVVVEPDASGKPKNITVRLTGTGIPPLTEAAVGACKLEGDKFAFKADIPSNNGGIGSIQTPHRDTPFVNVLDPQNGLRVTAIDMNGQLVVKFHYGGFPGVSGNTLIGVKLLKE